MISGTRLYLLHYACKEMQLKHVAQLIILAYSAIVVSIRVEIFQTIMQM